MTEYTAGAELYIEQLKRNIKKLEDVIYSQRHEIALQAKYREEDRHARQLLDKNACHRRAEELEAQLQGLWERYGCTHDSHKNRAESIVCGITNKETDYE